MIYGSVGMKFKDRKCFIDPIVIVIVFVYSRSITKSIQFGCEICSIFQVDGFQIIDVS